MNRNTSDRLDASTSINLDLRSDGSSASSASSGDGNRAGATELTVRPDRSEMPNSVAVVGTHDSEDNTETEILGNYFSARNRSGGDEIRHCYWDHHAFVIVFGSNEPVKRVIARPHDDRFPGRKVIAVELDDVEQIGKNCRTLSVECAPDDISMVCALYDYLNQRGVRTSSEWDRANRRIVIVVNSVQDIRRVNLETNRETEVVFNGRRLTLTRMEPISWVPWIDGEVEENAVLLTHIESEFSREDLTEYFQPWCRQSERTVVNTRTGRNGRSLVLFDRCIDFKKVRRWVQMHPFKMHLVGVEYVPAVTCARISNFCPDSNRQRQELVDLFASVVRRHRHKCVSGDCDVNDEHVETFSDGNYVTIKFHCRPVLDSVLSDASIGTFQGIPLDISLDYDI